MTKDEESAATIARLTAAMRGWYSYAWKDGIYVDDVQEYFDLVLGGTDPAEALKIVSDT